MVTVSCAAVLEAAMVRSWVIFALCLLSVILSAWHYSAFEPDIPRVCQVQPKPASGLTTVFDCAIS